MSVETETKKDHYWTYIAALTIVLVGVIVTVKLSGNEKYDPIRQQLDEESAQMNIRVLN